MQFQERRIPVYKYKITEKMDQTLLFILPFMCAVVWSDAASPSDSNLDSLLNEHNQRGCVCQVNVNPGCGNRGDEDLSRENIRMNETIWLLQQEIRRLKGGHGKFGLCTCPYESMYFFVTNY